MNGYHRFTIILFTESGACNDASKLLQDTGVKTDIDANVNRPIIRNSWIMVVFPQQKDTFIPIEYHICRRYLRTTL